MNMRQEEYLFIFALGATFGSFIALCADRLPKGQPVFRGFSKCNYCGKALRWLDKLPIAGYFIVGGKSRCCSKPIPRRYPLIEAGTGALFTAVYIQHPDILQSAPAYIFLVFLLPGMLIDLRHRIIPDKITVSGMFAGLALAVFALPIALKDALLGMLICGGYLYLASVLGSRVLRKQHVIGGGDIKYAAMIGAFLGLAHGFIAILAGALLATVYGILKMLMDANFRSTRELPFGPFLAMGAVFALLWGTLIYHWYISTFALGSL